MPSKFQSVEEIQAEIRASLPERPKPKTRNEILKELYQEIIEVQVKIEIVKMETERLEMNTVISNVNKELAQKYGWVKRLFLR